MVKYIRATLGHLPKIEALENACFTVDAFSHRRLRNLVVSQNAIVLLAEAGDDVIGCCIGLIRREGGLRPRRMGRLYSICVRDDYRCRNIATELLSWLEGIFFTRGVNCITLEVREYNIPARKFYEKHGFLQEGIITNYYRDGANAIKMKKHLTADSYQLTAISYQHE